MSTRMAHESGEDLNPLHCPWCGSGQIIAEPTGSIGCDYCRRSFTVSLQPSYPAMPMEPDQLNAGAFTPGTDTDPQEMAPQATPDQMQQMPPATDGAPGLGGPPTPPYPEQTFATAAGHRLGVEDYIDHLAMAHTPDAATTLNRLRRRHARA